MTKEKLTGKAIFYKELMNKLNADELDAPEGTLRISMTNNSTRYYQHLEKTSDKDIYIHSSEIDIAKKLAQKAYNDKVSKLVTKRYGQISRILKDFNDYELDELFENMHESRKILVTPIKQPFSQKLEQWSSLPYDGKGFSDDTPIITTNAGLRVRSKSERHMAEYFDSIGLFYKYECPLHLKNYGIVYPDFTFLSKKTDQEIYWEHEGMMDNPEYAKKAVKKIELYEKNGIFPGENLILTFETSSTILDVNIMKEFVEKYLLP